MEVERPVEMLPASLFSPAAADVGSAAGGLPEELAGALAVRPALPAVITAVTAQGETGQAGTCTLQFTCAQPDYKTQIDGVLLLHKGRQIFLLPDFPRLGGQLLARWKESVVLVRFSARSFAPGSYTVTLCGSQRSKVWQFTVR